MSEVISACLHLAAGPVPFLGAAFKVFGTIWSLVQSVEGSKVQLKVLTECIAHLLLTLDGEYRAGRLEEHEAAGPLADLLRLLEEIGGFVQKQQSYNFFRFLIVNSQRLSDIESYHKRLEGSVAAFQISALIKIQDWQGKSDRAREADQLALHERLRNLEANQMLLLEALNLHQNNALAMLSSLKRRIDEQLGGPRELQFYSHAYQAIATASGQEDTFHLDPWTISRLDVEFGPLIGVGGFGKVYSGTWNQLKVALKVMKGAAGVVPHPATMRREVEVWSKLRHPHILQFLGANVLDDTPFIVMPFIKHGNARNYIQDHPSCDRLKILRHVALGLVYLHSNNVIHGDIKGVNILIDDAESALLCDFGLTRIKSDINSRTESTTPAATVFGSRCWMAPELLLGGRLRKPCDVYSFGMTMYELFTADVPLGHIPPGELRELVAEQDIRPERPDDEEAPQLTDDAWSLARRCWVKDPSQRLDAETLCQLISVLEPVSLKASLPSNRRPSRPESAISTTPDRPLSSLPSPPPLDRISITSSSPSIALRSKIRQSSAMLKAPKKMPTASQSSGSSSSLSNAFQRAMTSIKSKIGFEPFTRAYSKVFELEHDEHITCAVFSHKGLAIGFGTADGRVRTLNEDPGLSRSPRSNDVYLPAPIASVKITALAFGFLDNLYGTANGDVIYESYTTGRSASAHHRREQVCKGVPLIDSTHRAGSVLALSARAIDAVNVHGHFARVHLLNAYTADNHVWSWRREDPDDDEDRIWALRRDKVQDVAERFKPILESKCKLKCASENGVTCVAFDASATLVATGRADGQVVLSKVATGKEVAFRSQFPALAQRKHLRMYDSVESRMPAVRGLAMLPDGKKIAAGYLSREIRLWDTENGSYLVLRPSDSVSEALDTPIPMCFYSFGKRIAYPAYNGASDIASGVILQDTVTAAIVRNFFFESPVTKGEVQSIHISPDMEKPKLIVLFSKGGAVVWTWPHIMS